MDQMLKVGQSYVLHVVPGWIQVICVKDVRAGIAVCDMAYVEGAKDNHCLWQLAQVLSREEALAVGGPLWPMPDAILNLESVTIAVPMAIDARQIINP